MVRNVLSLLPLFPVYWFTKVISNKNMLFQGYNSRTQFKSSELSLVKRNECWKFHLISLTQWNFFFNFSCFNLFKTQRFSCFSWLRWGTHKNQYQEWKIPRGLTPERYSDGPHWKKRGKLEHTPMMQKWKSFLADEKTGHCQNDLVKRGRPLTEDLASQPASQHVMATGKQSHKTHNF